jgi:hypothetical protein
MKGSRRCRNLLAGTEVNYESLSIGIVNIRNEIQMHTKQNG